MKIEGLDISWLGHSAFFINDEKKIYIDPYKIKAKEKADIILVTHSHYDHCSIEDLRKIVKEGTIIVIPADCQSKFSKFEQKLKIYNLEVGQSLELDKIKIKAVPAYNVNKRFHGKEEYWNGYVIEVNGKRIYHAGDTDLIPEMSALDNIDIALLPVGGTYTMTAEEAARAAILIRPKLTIPMHYSSIVGTNEDALRFLDACSNEGISCKVLEFE